ncbi:MAG: SDR family oxidoreductase [Pseudomonadota bacterium]
MSQDIFPLKGKRAIVTGAAVGLGKAYASALANQGVHLALCDIRPELDELASQLREHTAVEVFAWQGDVSDPELVRHVVDGAMEQLEGIDILINNAGVWGASQADDDLEKSLFDYDTIVGTNLKGPYLFGRAVIPLMIEQGSGGDIINIATDHMVTCGTPDNVCPKLPSCPSHWAEPPRPTSGGSAMDLYDASKWGLNGFLYAWAKYLRPHNIRVNAFCMGATDSHMLRSFHNYNPSEEEVSSWMRAEDNARVLVELLREGPDGRNAQNMNFCIGRPVQLEPPNPIRYILETELAQSQ